MENLITLVHFLFWESFWCWSSLLLFWDFTTKSSVDADEFIRKREVERKAERKAAIKALTGETPREVLKSSFQEANESLEKLMMEDASTWNLWLNEDSDFYSVTDWTQSAAEQRDHRFPLGESLDEVALI